MELLLWENEVCVIAQLAPFSVAALAGSLATMPLRVLGQLNAWETVWPRAVSRIVCYLNGGETMWHRSARVLGYLNAEATSVRGDGAAELGACSRAREAEFV